jgi:hypothetical protein
LPPSRAAARAEAAHLFTRGIQQLFDIR